MKHFLVALAVVPLLIGPALANPPCRTCVRSYPVQQRAAVIVKEKIVAVQVPVVVVPTYSATFIPPAPIIVQQGSTSVGAQSTSYTQVNAQAAYGLNQPVQAVQAQAVQQVSAQSDQLVAALNAINQRLCALEGQLRPPVAPPPPAPPAPVAPPIVQPARLLPRAFITSCAKCHDQGVADARGGGFRMFEAGKLAAFTDHELRRIATRTYAGEMPPRDNHVGAVPLVDQEVAEIQEWVNRQK